MTSRGRLHLSTYLEVYAKMIQRDLKPQLTLMSLSSHVVFKQRDVHFPNYVLV